MDTIIDPFVGDGYSLSTLTDAVNVFPNRYGRLNEIGIFGQPEGVTTRSVLVERVNGVLNLLPSKPLGSPGTVGKAGKGVTRSFVIPHIPHDDALMPEDIAGRRMPGQTGPMPQDVALARKLEAMGAKHDITLEYLRMGAVKGIILDADGSTLYNLYTEFGISQKSVDFVLGTAGTEVPEKCREVVRHIEQNLQGEVMTSVRALVDPTFFDKLIKHATVKDAFKYFSTTGAQPLREDTRRFFPFHNIVFEEYIGTATFQNQDDSTTARPFIAAGEGHAFPLGSLSTFKNYFAPADFNETVNTIGLPKYAKLEARKFQRGWDIHSQSNPLPLCRRPEILVRLHTSN